MSPIVPDQQKYSRSFGLASFITSADLEPSLSFSFDINKPDIPNRPWEPEDEKLNIYVQQYTNCLYAPDDISGVRDLEQSLTTIFFSVGVKNKKIYLGLS